jgi:hypothetical protein
VLTRPFALIAIAVVAMSGCSSPPPDLARGASSNYAFKAAVQRRFPVGSDESVLIAELRRERLSIEPETSKRDHFIAGFEAPGVPCKGTWTILWSTDQRKISDIEARYGEICL